MGKLLGAIETSRSNQYTPSVQGNEEEEDYKSDFEPNSDDGDNEYFMNNEPRYQNVVTPVKQKPQPSQSALTRPSILKQESKTER